MYVGVTNRGDGRLSRLKTCKVAELEACCGPCCAGAELEAEDQSEADAAAAAEVWRDENEAFAAIYGDDATPVAPRHTRLQLELPPEAAALASHQAQQVLLAVGAGNLAVKV